MRRRKRVIITQHCIKQMIDRRFFRTVEDGTRAIIRIVKNDGYFIPEPYEDKNCRKWRCVFKSNLKKYLTLIVLEYGSDFIVKTILDSSDWDIFKYQENK